MQGSTTYNISAHIKRQDAQHTISANIKCQDVDHTISASEGYGGIRGGGLCRVQVNSEQVSLESLGW